MKKYTIEELKLLFKPNLHFEKKIIENFIYKLVYKLIPLVTHGLEDFLNDLSKESKNSINSREEHEIFRGHVFDWKNKYIKHEKHYLKLSRRIIFEFKNILSNMGNEEVEVLNEEEVLNFATEMASECISSFDELLEKNFNHYIDELKSPSNKEEKRIKEFIEISIASFFNNISLINNKKTITHLLDDAINNNKYKNYKKIFNVDPTVYQLDIVKKHISNLDLRIESEITGYYSESLKKPIMFNQKNKICQTPLMLIGIFNTMGIVTGEISFSNSKLYELAVISGMNDIDTDNNEFNRLLKHLKKPLVKAQT